MLLHTHSFCTHSYILAHFAVLIFYFLSFSLISSTFCSIFCSFLGHNICVGTGKLYKILHYFYDFILFYFIVIRHFTVILWCKYRIVLYDCSFMELHICVYFISRTQNICYLSGLTCKMNPDMMVIHNISGSFNVLCAQEMHVEGL